MKLLSLRRFEHPLVRRAVAIVRLLRPLNVVMIVVGVLLGGVLSGGAEAVQGTTGARLLRAALAAALIGGAGNVSNDVFDLEADRINRPGRPLPRGQVGPLLAKQLAALGMAGGLALAATLSGLHLALALGAVGGLLIYNVKLQHVPLAGNLMIALLVALALLYGGATAGPLAPALIGSVFAFLTTLAREIIKDLDDAEGDAAAGARTLPLVLGPARAAALAAAVLGLTLVLTPLPYFLLGYTGTFLLALLPADALLLYVAWLLLGPLPERHAPVAGHLLKAAMLLGMTALALGALVTIGL